MRNFNFKKKIENIFMLYETCLGIDVTESEIFFIKIARLKKGYKKKFELRKVYSADQGPFKTIEAIIQKYHLSSTYCSLNFHTKRYLAKLVDFPDPRPEQINQYLSENSWFHLPLTKQKEQYFHKYLIDYQLPEKIRILNFIGKKIEIETLIRQISGLPNLSFLAFNDLITLLLVPVSHLEFCGWHLHFRFSDLLIMKYDKGHLTFFQMCDTSGDLGVELTALDLFSPHSRPVIITGTTDMLGSLDIPNMNSDPLGTINIRCQKEFFNALCCSLMPFLGLINPSSTIFFPPERWFCQKRFRNILIKIVVFLYLTSLCILLTNWIIRTALNNQMLKLKILEIRRQSLMASYDQIIEEQNHLKECLHKYQSIIYPQFSLATELYQLIRCVPENLYLSKLQMKNSKKITDQILVQGFSYSKNAVIDFLNHLESKTNFRKVALENFELPELLNHKIPIQKGSDGVVEFQIRIDL